MSELKIKKGHHPRFSEDNGKLNYSTYNFPSTQLSKLLQIIQCCQTNLIVIVVN